MKKLFLLLIAVLTSQTTFASDYTACVALKALSVSIETSVLMPEKNPINTKEALIISNTRNTHIRAILKHDALFEIETLLKPGAELALFDQFKSLYRGSIDTRSCKGNTKASCVEDLNRQTEDMEKAVNLFKTVENVVCNS